MSLRQAHRDSGDPSLKSLLPSLLPTALLGPSPGPGQTLLVLLPPALGWGSLPWPGPFPSEARQVSACQEPLAPAGEEELQKGVLVSLARPPSAWQWL